MRARRLRMYAKCDCQSPPKGSAVPMPHWGSMASIRSMISPKLAGAGSGCAFRRAPDRAARSGRGPSRRSEAWSRQSSGRSSPIHVHRAWPIICRYRAGHLHARANNRGSGGPRWRRGLLPSPARNASAPRRRRRRRCRRRRVTRRRNWRRHAPGAARTATLRSGGRCGRAGESLSEPGRSLHPRRLGAGQIQPPDSAASVAAHGKGQPSTRSSPSAAVSARLLTCYCLAAIVGPYRMKKWWPGAESNCRHVDFQSTALPTELPGRRAAYLIG